MANNLDNLDLNTIPTKALNCSTRLLLGQYLNPEQNLLTKEGFARDYRGLAEQMDFQYNDIRNFQRSDNPTFKILEAWTSQAHSTIGQLVQYLENMGRHDIVQDLQAKFKNDAKSYFQKSMKHSYESPLQVPEVTSCRIPDSRLDDSDILTREDANTGEYTIYDAFVCYADEDIQFVSKLATFLESELGFKLFIRSRDMLAGHSEYETSMQLIQERCKRVLIILSPDFLRCSACEVQASFAAGLGIDEKCRKLIPIVYKPCEIPLMLKYISKIDFTKPGGVKDWIWEQLISSLQDGPSSTFTTSEKRYPPMCNSLPQLELGLLDSGNPAITFPPSTSVSSLCVAGSNTLSPSPTVVHEILSDSALNVVKSSVKQKTKLQNFRFWKLPKKVDAYHGNNLSSSSILSSSNATSGFHSHVSDGSAESLAALRKPCSQDTAI